MSPTHVVLPSPIGELTIVADGGSITHVLMDAAKYRPEGADVLGERGDPRAEPFAGAATQLEAYFSGELREFDLPLAAVGTPWQRTVWDALRKRAHAVVHRRTGWCSSAGVALIRIPTDALAVPA